MSRILWPDKTLFQGYLENNLPNGAGILKIKELVYVGSFKQGYY